MTDARIEEMAPGDGENLFWTLAQHLLAQAEVSRSTMMGLPCLRVNGAFFASCDRKTGELLVKLPAARVAELIAAGQAEPFAPAGRRFREWAAVPTARSGSWKPLLQDALAFVGGQP
ncbi:hypothetical protein [Mycobacterium attenuatum]|uniref:hypothetical protein n=1 Tax=Mycobacterium attenuatum TaxID=2341086 RepID=UPI000F145272|nr:hypothetical protein [Mycobacterium attenuatum]VBA46123.1 hypothetical protein LAUMK191_00534 [Mycobacterium attenuatum]VBA47821.1 hypothetical protein LAUMK41_00605 [Mycobacterium attenuatum]